MVDLKGRRHDFNRNAGLLRLLWRAEDHARIGLFLDVIPTAGPSGHVPFSSRRLVPIRDDRDRGTTSSIDFRVRAVDCRHPLEWCIDVDVVQTLVLAMPPLQYGLVGAAGMACERRQKVHQVWAGSL